MATKIGHQARTLFGRMHSKSTLTRDGHRDRAERIGDMLAAQGLRNIEQCKTKHVQKLFSALREQGLSAGTLANYASTMRQIAERIGKQNICPRTNQELGFARTAAERYQPMKPDRDAIQTVSDKLAAGRNGNWQTHAHAMQREFGLRLKESLMSGQVVERDGKRYLVVEGAKGGRPRDLEIRTAAQEATLTARNEFVAAQGWRSLCPPDRSLEQGWKSLSNAVYRAGGTRDAAANSHANRHAYAQDLDAAGASRGEIAEKLGHGRESAAGHYVE